VAARDPYYLTAEQAADALGVTRATLYAYTSRGQVRSEPVAGRPRERRYARDDNHRL
jgi:citrate synthase